MISRGKKIKYSICTGPWANHFPAKLKEIATALIKCLLMSIKKITQLFIQFSVHKVNYIRFATVEPSLHSFLESYSMFWTVIL